MNVDSIAAVADYGIALALGCSPRQAMSLLRTLALKGIPEAQVALGQALLYRAEDPDSLQQAVCWFETAARSAHAPGMNMLGRCLERGWGVAVNEAAAVTCYKHAAELGLDWAQYNLANAALRGRGMTRDLAQAYDYFHRAATQGHAKSMNLVGRCLEEGWGTGINQLRALHWYRRAAEAGDYRGQFNWATCLARQGCQAEAAKWFLRAACQATPDLLAIIAKIAAGAPAYSAAASIARNRLEVPSKSVRFARCRSMGVVEKFLVF